MVKRPIKTVKETPPPKKEPEPRRDVREITPPQQSAGAIMRPTVIVVGADKGGVGKTTIARAVLDFLSLNSLDARAFDTETPRGTLYRFHPEETMIVDLTSTADQMKIIDTLNSSEAKVSIIDVRAGGLSPALEALDEIGFFDAVKAGEFRFILLHVIGPSIASLDEIAEIAPYMSDANYFMVKNHVNDTTFFEWNPQTHSKYFEDVNTTGEITIPKLGELAYEQVEIAGTPYSTFIANQTAEGEPADHSFVLRGYVRTWLARVADEFERVGLLDLITTGVAKGR
ncbi:hypothetical protein MJC1_02339 [Methylocystis sp. MJC1]|jgi:hypothetical protein|nr:hypothetical protein MJC1_02339 [Methylocystis sp. MJC1]MBU6525762.1 hypothetical protein [Methylocystis sp. MJC1]